MKFVCDKCRTKYTIADDKVRGKVLKIRCKNCGNIIEVREPSSRPAAAARPAHKPPTQGALKAAARHGGTRKRTSAVAKLGPSGLKTRGSSKTLPRVGAAADRSKPASAASQRKSTARSSGQGLAKRPALPSKKPAFGPPDEDPKTVVAAMPEELLREFRGGGTPSPSQTPADDEDGWFLGDDRGEYGPMTFAELAARCQRGEPGPNAEAWKDGYGDWRPIEDIPALKPYVRVAPPPRPVAGGQPAPASPYTKTPKKDAVDHAPTLAPKAPLPAKVTPAAPVNDSLVKIPKAAPAPKPAAAEQQWRELPPIQPSAPTPAPQTAAAALAPEPFLPAAAVATPAAPALGATGAHVSPGASPSALNPSLVDIKRDRRPTLLIGAGVLLLSIGVIALVVYLITSGKKPSKTDSGATADSGMTMRPAPMRAATAVPLAMRAVPAPMDDDTSAEFNLDIDVSTGKVSKGKRRRRKRGGNGMKSAPSMATMSTTSSMTGLYGLPTMRGGFVGLMGFGTMSMTSVSSSGGRPGDLRSVIKRNYNRLRRCYEKAARLNSRIKNPKLRITVKVTSSGRCTSVYVSPARYQSNSLGICVRRTIMSWRWPTFSTTYRWTFSARFSAG